MARKGRKPIPNVHRRPGGRISRARGARTIDDVIESQPHRAPFDKLMGAAGAALAGTALGRLRLIGMAENAYKSPLKVARILGLPYRDGGNGLTERQHAALSKYAEVVGRERWVRATPKDRPQALDFLQARGIGLNVRELTDKQARDYIADFNRNREALLSIGDKVKLGEGKSVGDAYARAAISAIDQLVIADRDIEADRLGMVRVGAEILAFLHFGPDQPDRRKLRGHVYERSTWSHDEKEIEILYDDGNGGTRGPNREKPERGWKGRHRSLAGG